MSDQVPKVGIMDVISKNKVSFFLNFFIILVLTFSILYLFGLVPTEFKTIIGREPVQESTGNRTGELPITIKIPTISVESPIYNPATTSVDVLNDFLTKGAVRYPGSGLLGGSGNIFIFGHSTGFKIVNNQAYKTFNGLQNLKVGDLVYIDSDKYEFTYKVSSVKLVDATKTLVEFNTNSKLLTLSTCDNFGAKTDRYVVEAEFVAKNGIKI